jgi:periplasmic protein CpxP/Spy
MKFNRLLIVSAVSVLIGGGSFVTSKALADQVSLIAQNPSPPTEQRQPGKEPRGGAKFDRLTGITEAQKAQLQQIHAASRQQMEAIPTAEQKARIEAIRNDARSKMEAVLTPEQRQQLSTSPPTGGERKGHGFPKISGLTDAQKTQMKAIRSATHQQMDAVLTTEQKAKMEAIRNDTKTKVDAVLTAQQRQELEQLHQQRQNRQ